MDLSAIRTYLSAAPRHRLVVLSPNIELPNVPAFDIGYTLSSYIVANSLRDSTQLSMLVDKEFHRAFNETVVYTEEFGNAIRLENFGITFEPKLGLDMRTVLKDLSRNVAIFIKWPGAIVKHKLMFLTPQSPDYIDLSEIQYYYHEI